MREEKKTKKYLSLVKSMLSNILGTDYEDIQPEYTLVDDLHMGPTEISDLIQMMSQKGIVLEESLINNEINTVEDLVNFFIENEEI